jgi:hypothetical protein
MALTCLDVGTLANGIWRWAVARGIMRTTCSNVVGWYFVEYVLFNHSLFFSSPSTPISVSPQMSIHTIHAAKYWTFFFQQHSLSFLIYSLFQHVTILAIFLQNLPRRITCVSVAAPIAMFAIPEVGWVVRLLEGWTNRLNMYDSIYAGLTGEPFWVA